MILDLLNKATAVVFKFHKPILIISFILTILTTLIIFRIDIRTDVLDALPSKNTAIDRFIDFINDFGSIDNLVVVLKSRGKKIDDYLETAESIGKKLKESPLIEYADYNILQSDKETMLKNFPLFLNKNALDEFKKRLSKEGIEKQIKHNKMQLLSPLSTPIDLELISKDPLNMRSIIIASVLNQGLNKISIKQGYYISSDNSMLIFFVKPIGSNRDIKFVKKFKDEIDRIFDEVSRGTDSKSVPAQTADLQLGITGPYAFAIESHTIIKRDVLINAFTSALLVLLLFQFVYRKRFLVLIITGITLLTALSWTLGIAYLIFGSLNMASSLITAMLMGLGIDYIIHVFNRCETEFMRSRDLRYSLDTTLAKTAPGVVTGALTTSAAFFSIVTTSFKGLYQLGVVAGIGVLACLVSTLFIMTSLIIFIETRRHGLLFSDRGQRFGIEGISRIIKDYPKPVIFISIGILLISFLGLSNIRFDNNPESIGPKTSNVMLLEKEVADNFGRQNNPLMLTVTAGDKEKLMEQYSRLEDVMKKWKDKGVIGDYNSLRFFLPPLGQQKESISALKEIRESINPSELEGIFRNALERNGFADSEQYTAYLHGIKNALNIKEPVGLGILEDVKDKKVRYFYNKDKSKAAAYLFPKNGTWDNASLSFIQKEVEGLGKGFILTGTNIMFANLKASIIRESILASIVASTVIFLIIYIQFKTIKRTVLVLTPLAVGFIMTLGFMGMTGIKFNYINIGAVTLLFGIGIDYGVYIFQDYCMENRGNAGESVKHAGRAVIMCAVTTIAGFGSLMTMNFRGIAGLGIVITIGVSACLLCALFLLPVLINYTEGNQ